MKINHYLASTCLAAAFATATTANAQTPAAQGDARVSTAASEGHNNVLNEIVVTAARQRAESVQSTPVAVTALNAALLERNQVASVLDLARIAPNLVIQRQLATANQVDIYLRGFGNISNDPAIDPPIALYVDGIYQPVGSGTQLDMFGVESMEVQRGPQGTLLGKNAPTGALSINGRRPTGEFGGALEASYERFNHKEIKGRVDIPIIEGVLAVNGSMAWKSGGNYIRALQFGGKRIFGGENVLAGRIGILFTPSSNFEWLVRLNGENTHNPQTGMRDLGYLPQQGPFQQPSVSCVVFGYCQPTERFTTNAGYRTQNVSDDRQISSQIIWHLKPVTLTAVTGFKTLNEVNSSDVDGSPAQIIDAERNPLAYQQFSQEVRISSAKGGGLDLGGHLDWVIGGFYSNYRYTNSQHLRIFVGAPGSFLLDSFQKGRTKSKAVFGHFVFNVTDKFNVSFGGRQSWDSKTHEFANVGDPTYIVDAPISFKNFSKEAGAQYKFTPNQNVYFRYAEGYRNGGYQGLPAGNIQRPYDAETVKTYEVGFKGDFFDHHLRTNLSLFQSDYKNLQRTAILPLTIPPFYGQFISNAASARVRGIEFESTIVPTAALTIAMSATYLDPKYKNYEVSLIAGEPAQNRDSFPFPYASKYTAKLAPQYVLDLSSGATITFGADATYSSTYYSGEVPYPSARIAPMVIVNGSIKYEEPNGKYYVTIYGQNLTNKYYLENYTTQPTAPGSASFFSIGADHKPITYGATVGVKF